MSTVHDILSLWDFSDPAASEGRFRGAHAASTEAWRDAYLTQVARTYGLRRRFAEARDQLAVLEPNLGSLPVLVQVLYWLERGRTFASAAHTPEDRSPGSADEARQSFVRAIDLAQSQGLTSLAVDAMHMMVFVDTEPQEQLAWNRKILDLITASGDPEVRGWLGPIHNNIGYALHLDGQFDAALDHFFRSKAAYEEKSDLAAARIADWMVAWTYRVMGRTTDALDQQLKNEAANAEAGTPDFYVFEELETLYSGLGDQARAAHYRELKERHRG